jgi:hypothetical protein
MAHSPRKPQQGSTLAAASLLVLAGLVAGPALAAPERDVLCDESREATLEVSTTALAPITVNASNELLEDHLLKPRVEATAREVFAESEKNTVDEESIEADEADVEATVPSLSDGQPKPYRRQMYRRDI